MLVTRFDPFAEFNELRRGFEHLNSVFNSLGTSEKENSFDFVPSVNTREADDAYFVEVDLPGIKKEDITIDVNDNVLSISGEREVKEEHKENEYYKIESRFGSFERRFTLPEDVDAEKIEASSKDGVLEVKIPKVQVIEKAPKKIEIK
ncbi:MAG: heat-shock protein Hsp20 [Helicobacteraceae bacterium 4484_230]|nr:MAG: heat-shock protein Hsp20 [Helicobacteraceae bacterium 4484_230]